MHLKKPNTCCGIHRIPEYVVNEKWLQALDLITIFGNPLYKYIKAWQLDKVSALSKVYHATLKMQLSKLYKIIKTYSNYGIHSIPCHYNQNLFVPFVKCITNHEFEQIQIATYTPCIADEKTFLLVVIGILLNVKKWMDWKFVDIYGNHRVPWLFS